MSFHWLYNLWYGYFYPSIKGNGPEALVQTVAYGAAAIAFWPKLRKAIAKEGALARGELKAVEAEERRVRAWLVMRWGKVKAFFRTLLHLRLTVVKPKAQPAPPAAGQTAADTMRAK